MYEYRESGAAGGDVAVAGARERGGGGAARAWRGRDYEVLERNCNHFCEALCEALGCEGPPAWLNAFANNARAARGAYRDAASVAERAYESAVSGVADAWAWLARGGGASTSSYASALDEDAREGEAVDGPRANDDDDGDATPRERE